MKKIAATGKEGYLILKDNNCYFRYYHDINKYTDYLLMTSNMCVKIQSHNVDMYLEKDTPYIK